jgi:large subunit ribosomal protein L22
MKIQAISRNVRISPRKVRLVADAIRVLPVSDALVTLQNMRKRAAYAIKKTLESALANAVNNAKLDRNMLRIADLDISDGQALKRFHPSTRGRIHPYKKRSSHIRVILEDRKEEVKTLNTKS